MKQYPWLFLLAVLSKRISIYHERTNFLIHLKMEFKVLLIDQRKMIKRLLLGLLGYVVVFSGFILVILNVHHTKEVFLWSLISLIIVFPLLIFGSVKSAYHQEIVVLNASSISTVRYGLIDLISISSIKIRSYNSGTGFELILNTGFKLSVLPTNPFSVSSGKATIDFYLALMKNYKKHDSSDNS